MKVACVESNNRWPRCDQYEEIEITETSESVAEINNSREGFNLYTTF